MSAKGKVNTVHLKRGDRIMVRLTSRDGANDEWLGEASATKVKDAAPMVVYDIREVVVGPRQRRAYDVAGVLADGTKIRLVAQGGNQTYWRAA